MHYILVISVLFVVMSVGSGGRAPLDFQVEGGLMVLFSDLVFSVAPPENFSADALVRDFCIIVLHGGAHQQR